MISRRQIGLAVLVLSGLLAAALPAEAAESKLGVSGKIGASWNLLNGPIDPAEEPTVLSGSAFDGAGFSLGAAGHYNLGEFKGAHFELEAGLLYSFQRGEGFEGVPATGERRILTLSTHVLQVPILVHLKSKPEPDGFRLGVGLSPLFGLQSAATVEVENSDRAPDLFHTTPVTHLGLIAALGYDISLNDEMSVPLELRINWDPAVGKSTLERLPDFVSQDEPGDYQVAFNWQLMLMAGFRYQL